MTLIRIRKEEGHYTIKRVPKLPNRGNTNWLYAIIGDSIEEVYRWNLNNEWETITIGAQSNLQEGTNVTITGTGTGTDPYVINSVNVTEEIVSPLNPYFGTRVEPVNTISGFYNTTNVNGATGFLTNNTSSGNGAISEIRVVTNNDVFSNNLGAGIALVAFGQNYFQPWLQNKTAIYGGNTDMHFILPTNQSDYIFSVGNTGTNSGNEASQDVVFRINQDKTILAPLLTNPVIDSATDDVLITKGWANSNLGTVGYTVATLPTGVIGDRAYVTDATAPSYLSPIVGGGTIVSPVFFNGTDWVSA